MNARHFVAFRNVSPTRTDLTLPPRHSFTGLAQVFGRILTALWLCVATLGWGQVLPTSQIQVYPAGQAPSTSFAQHTLSGSPRRVQADPRARKLADWLKVNVPAARAGAPVD